MSTSSFFSDLDMPEVSKSQENSFFSDLSPKTVGRTGAPIASKEFVDNAIQIPLGLFKKATYLVDLWNAAATGESLAELEDLDPYRIAQLRQEFPQVEWPEPGKEIDKTKFLQSIEQAQASLPTQENIEKAFEERLKISLRPKTPAQKRLRLGGEAASFPAETSQKVISGLLAPTYEMGLEEAGVPEQIAEPVAFGLSQLRVPAAAEEESFLGITKRPPTEPSAGEPPSDLISYPSVGDTEKIGPSGIQELVKSSKVNPDKIGDVFSKRAFKNTSQGGKAISNEIRALDDAAYKAVNKNYEISRSLNKGVIVERPILVGELRNSLKELEQIPSLSSPEKQLRTSIKQILKRLEGSEAGEFVGTYKPISNQILIDQIQSLRKKVDYDFAHGDASNIFRPTIRHLQESVENAASSNPKALNAWKEATNSYREWAETFDSPYVRPLRNTSNKDFSKMYKRTLDVDEYGVLKDVLNKSKKGRALSEMIERDLIEKRLGKFYKDPSKITLRELGAELRELEDIIDPKKLNKVMTSLLKAQKASSAVKLGKNIAKKAAFYGTGGIVGNKVLKVFLKTASRSL